MTNSSEQRIFWDFGSVAHDDRASTVCINNRDDVNFLGEHHLVVDYGKALSSIDIKKNL